MTTGMAYTMYSKRVLVSIVVEQQLLETEKVISINETTIKHAIFKYTWMNVTLVIHFTFHSLLTKISSTHETTWIDLNWIEWKSKHFVCFFFVRCDAPLAHSNHFSLYKFVLVSSCWYFYDKTREKMKWHHKLEISRGKWKTTRVAR